MSEITHTTASPQNMTINNGSWKDCAFFKYNIPPEIRIPIWELYFYNEPPPPTALYRTPSLIKALRMKEKPELYHDTLQLF
jgi:hypothetical protein